MSNKDLQGKSKEIQKVGYGNPPAEYQWPSGVSGNPKGKPPGPSIRNILEKLLDEQISDSAQQKTEEALSAKIGRKLTRKENLLLSLYHGAVGEGKVKAATELLDRLEGKAAQPVDHSGSVETVFRVKIDGPGRIEV